MSLFVLDTDILSLYRYGHPLVCQRINSPPPAELAITVLTVEEQLAGWYALLRQAKQPQQLAQAYQRLAESVQFLATWRILPFSEQAIARYQNLVALRLNVAKLDLRIAAVTLEHTATLVTRNTRDFQRTPNLPIVDCSV